jgi:hypothetical protein
MGVKEVVQVPTIEWDDGLAYIFSFSMGGQKIFAGFIHMQAAVAAQVQKATNTQINDKVQESIAKAVQVQLATDPACWIDTLKNGLRTTTPVKIIFDDATNWNYSTKTGKNFVLQSLFSIVDVLKP